MARNFGVRHQTNRSYRCSFWPLLQMAFIAVGVVEVATHLHHW